MRGRPELPNSYVVNVDDILASTHGKVHDTTEAQKLDVDIVIPVYASFPEKTAVNIMWIIEGKLYSSTRSYFVQCLESDKDEVHYYIFDKFKSNNVSHRKSYKQETYEVPYPEEGVEPIFVPVYWRIN